MPKKPNKKDNYLTSIVDSREIQKYKRKGKRRKRAYEVLMHRNNLNFGRYCAYFGYWNKGELKRLYMKCGYDCESLKENLYYHYENHIKILINQLKILEVSSKLLKSGYCPIQKDGEPLPSFYYDETFRILKIYDKGDFDIKIIAKDGTKFRVDSEHFRRVYPDNWFLE